MTYPKRSYRLRVQSATGGGQVYVMHNPLDPPNLFKIGMTKLTTARLHKRWHPWEDALAALIDEYTPRLPRGAAAVPGTAGGIYRTQDPPAIPQGHWGLPSCLGWGPGGGPAE